MPQETQRVEVEWIDSSMILPGWNDALTVEKTLRAIDLTCHTAGYLVYENDDLIVVALSRGANEVGDGMAIPRSAIQRITPLSDKPRGKR